MSNSEERILKNRCSGFYARLLWGKGLSPLVLPTAEAAKARASAREDKDPEP